MQKRRFEKVAAVLLSILMLMTSTGIVSTLASNVVNESSSAPVSSTTEISSETSTSATQNENSAPELGDGTKENPYKISTLTELKGMSEKVKAQTTYFVLTADIDLAAVTADDFEGGSLLALTEKQSFVFDGNGFGFKGLNVELEKGESASIFGSIGENSTVKNLQIVKPIIKSTSDEMKSISLVAVVNKGIVSGVAVTYPALTAEVADYAAFIVAANYGTVADVSVTASHTNISASTADNHTISAIGTVGAVAALNHGTVSNASALNVGMFVPESESVTVYGGLVGANSGAVLNSVSTGNVMGGKSTDVVGGVVGKAVAPVGGEELTSTLTNNYTLVAISKTVSGNAVIGADGKAEMMTDCFWASAVSGRDTAVDDCTVGEISTTEFKLIPEGKTATLTADDIKSSAWGKAIFELDGEFKVKGEGFTAVTENGTAEITAETAGKVANVTYFAKIILPSNVGAASGAKTIKQYMKVALISVAADAKGNGTEAKPFVIKTASDFALYKYAPRMYAVLGADIKGATVPAIKGALDGKGYTVTVAKPLVSNVYGEIKNVNVSVSASITTAVLGNAIGANVSGVSVTMAEGTALNPTSGDSGILFNRVGAQSVIDDCRVQGDIVITADKLANIGGFAGLVDGEKTAVTNSGAVVNISVAEKLTAQSVAGFVGSVAADDVAISNCYIGGENLAGEYMFVAALTGKNIKIENITTAFGEAIALDFERNVDVNKNQFNAWAFDGGAVGFFTGNSGSFAITLPDIKAFNGATADDFSVACDEKLLGSVSVDGKKATLKVERAEGVITVKALPVVLRHNKTGLTAEINISNGLEKDASGRYVISTAYDLAYVSENIAELYASDFIMTNDVDMSVLGDFAPIGTTDVAFSGTFDGNGKTITNLTIDGTAKVGLFGALSGAAVKSLTIKNAEVSAKGGYVGVLAGHVTGETEIQNITVDGAKVQSSDLYAGALLGAANGGESTLTISGVTVKNSSVKSEANYIGALAGRVNGGAEIFDITVDGFTASGAGYVAGAVGLVKGDFNATLKNVNVNNATLSGVSEVSGVASGNGLASISSASVKGSKLSTVGFTAANTAGGIAAVFSNAVTDVSVENTEISAGVAGGIVGKTAAECKLTIKNASVKACAITASGANAVAAGILGVHNVEGVAKVENVTVDGTTSIGGGAVNAGLVGDCSGVDSGLILSDSKTLATVTGGAGATASAGALGRLGVSAVNNVYLANLKVGGKVEGGSAVGGVIGLIRGGKAYESYTPIVSDCVIFTQFNTVNASSAGMIVGAVEDEAIFGDKAVFAIKGVILSTYSDIPVYPSEVFIGGYTDIEKAVFAAPSALTTKDATEIEISGTPKLDGYSFDTQTGWVSESEDRIQVVSSTENSAVLKASRRADVSIVGYYVLDSDSDVRIPVHFRMVSLTAEPLKGSGTETDPYLINNAYDLETMADYAGEGAYFALTTNIVLTEADFEFGGSFYNVGNGVLTIGDEQNVFNGTFTGRYNGEIHSITGLKIKGNALGGLFGATDGAVITDLVIDGAEISATTYGGVLVGKAKDTVIKNVTINSSSVETTSFGSAVGGVIGVAESTTVENVTLNGAKVTSALDATSATVEYAGGVAGIFSGVIKNVNVTATVASNAVAGGFVGLADGSAYVMSSEADVNVKADIAGGVVGQLTDTMGFGVSGVQVSGTVYGAELSAGVIAEVVAEAETSFDKLNSSLISETVVLAAIRGDEISAVVIGEVSEEIATDKANENADVFNNIYYSSYQNNLGAFGKQGFNAYQNSEYEITDLSALSSVKDGVSSAQISLGTEFTVLGEDSIILGGGEGTYKSFTAGGRVFELQDIKSDVKGLVTYDKSASAVKLNRVPAESAKLVFVYNNSLETAIEISAESDEPVINGVNVNCSIINATGKAELSDKLVAVMLKTESDNGVKSMDFFTALDTAERAVGALEVADGKIYVAMQLPEGCRFTVNATDENGNALDTQPAGNEGVVVSANGAAAVSLSITVENNTVAWGLRALWSAIGK